MENVAMPHLPVRPDWLVQRIEAPMEPERPIVDPHHHLWERPGARYLFHDMLEDTGAGHNILATVYIQCRSMHRKDGPAELATVGEVEFAVGAAAMAESGHYGPTRICAGIVGNADLSLGEDVGRVLDALIAAGGGRLKGIRCPMAKSGDPAIVGSVVDPRAGMMAEEAVAAAVRVMGRKGLVLDTWSFQSQLDDLLVLVDRAPDTVIVVDHVGGVMGIGSYAGRREALFPVWREKMAALAARPNTRVKLGGLAMHSVGFGFETRALPPSSEELAAAWKPYIDACIGLWGPERAMFESNFPVDKGQVSYTNMWNAFLRLSSGASEDDKDRLFRRTAAETYRLSV